MKWTTGYTRQAYPLTILPIFIGNTSYKKEAFGKADKKIISEFSKGKMNAFWEHGNADYFSKVGAQKILRDATFMNKVKQEIKKNVYNLVQFTNKLTSEDIKKYTNKKLFALLTKFNDLHARMFGWGLINTYDQELVRIFKVNLDKKFNTQKAQEIFNILTTSTIDTIFQKEEKDLIKIILEIKKDPEAKKIFLSKNPQEINKIIPRINKKINNLILKLKKNYFYTLINYEGKARNKLDFIKRIKRESVLKKDWRKKYKDLLKRGQKLKKAQKTIIKKEKIEVLTLRLAKAIIKNAELREYRKPATVKAVFYSRILLKEIAKRLRINLVDVKFLLPQEINTALNLKKLDKNLIKQRRKYCVLVITSRDANIFSGQAARKIIRGLEIFEGSKKEVKGIVAYTGKITGKVRLILSPREIKSFKKGEILVTHATSPDFIQIFKKAAGVVTDEGGLTSHAAIVSRELRIPCIVGTKNATKVLKTGDLITLEGDRGLIKLNKK